MNFLFRLVGFFLGSLLVFGSPTSICHDGDVDLIFVDKMDSEFVNNDTIVAYFSKREPNAAGDLRLFVMDGVSCTFEQVDGYKLSERLITRNRENYTFNPVDGCDKFSNLRKHIDKRGKHKKFLIFAGDFDKALSTPRKFQRFHKKFPSLHHIILNDHYAPQYYKPEQNIHFRKLATNLELIGAKFCRVCPQGWINFTNPQKPHVSSCYYLGVRDKPISWIQARDACRKNDSILVSFETSEELEYVLNDIRLNVVQRLKEKSVYIGLMSKQFGRDNVFRWTSGGPFILPWTKLSYIPGSCEHENCISLACLPTKDELGQKNVSTTCKEPNIELSSLCCLQNLTNFFLCELEMAREFNGENDRIKIPSLQLTVPDHKEFVKIRNNIVSVSNKEHDNPEFKFDCGDNLQHVPYSAVCDTDFDCDNGRDEEYCYKKTQSKAYDDRWFTCDATDHYSLRILSHKVCDSIIDCTNGADEIKCEGRSPNICSDGTYVPSSWFRGKRDRTCFLSNECNSTHPEMSLKQRNFTDNCAFPRQLIYGISVCKEGIVNGKTYDSINNMLQQKRWSPACLYIRRSKYDLFGCPDMSHLQDCQLYKCPDDFIKCPHDYCIPFYYINDGIMDCRYGEDETQNINLKGRRYFMCNSGTFLLHPNNTCDGEKQCASGEDELNCNELCPKGFKCEGGVAYAISSELFLNEHNVNNKKETVHISYLNITNHDWEHFPTYSYRKLFKLVMSNCKINNESTILYNLLDKEHLYFLDFSYNKLDQISRDSHLHAFPNLRFLNLSHNAGLHTVELGGIGSKRLHTVDISYTKLSVLQLQTNDQIYPLRSLNLYKTKITNLGCLQNIQYVEHLDIRDTLLTNDVLSTDDLSNITIKISLKTDMFKLCCPSYRGPGVPAHVCSSPPDAVSSCEDLMSDILKSALLWMVATIAFVGNITVIYYRVFQDRGVFKKAYGVFVTNLGVSDLLMGTYLILIATVDVHYRDVYVINEAHWRHSDLCKAAGFLSTLSSETSTFFIFLITVDRFLVMRYPFGNHGFKKWSVVLSVVLTWCAGIIMASLPLTFDSWELYSSNGLCLGLPLNVSRLNGWPYSFAIFIVLNLCMFLLIALGQVTIFRSMANSRDNFGNRHDFNRRLQNIAVAKRLSLVALSNFLCWFPICVIGLRSKFGTEPNPETLAWLLVIVLPLNAAVNPLIYTIPAVYIKWQSFKQSGYHFTRRPNLIRT